MACVHLRQYLNEFFCKIKNVLEKFVAKITAHIKFNNFCPPNKKNPAVLDNVEKYDRAGQATYDNKIQRMRFACCITKATDTRSEYVILIDFPR